MGDTQQDIVRETALTSQGRGASEIAALAVSKGTLQGA